MTQFDRGQEELKAAIALESKLQELFHQTVADIAKSSIDRIRDSAKYVQIAATAVQGVYAGVLGFVFAADGKPLPFRGILPAGFLALAMVLATFFLAFLQRPGKISLWPGADTPTDNQLARSFYLATWAQSGYVRRRWLLQAATVALAVGVAFIPLPFITPANAPAAAAAAAAPTIPDSIPEPIEAKAVEVFEAQANEYLESVGAVDKKQEDSTCSENKLGLRSVFWQCAWDDSETEVNTASMWLAVWGLILVVAVPLISWVVESRRDRSRVKEA